MSEKLMRNLPYKIRVFCDMDGPVVNFDGYCLAQKGEPKIIKHVDGAYLAMEPEPGAIEALRVIISMGFELWMASKPVTVNEHNSYSYRDKPLWILRHIPELKRRIILTHDKGLLGCSRDYLIDDRPHKANCEEFTGTFIHYTDGNKWPEIIDFFKAERRRIIQGAMS